MGDVKLPTPAYQIPGARWLRCDLHVHTPFDPAKKFGENVQHAIEAFRNQKPQKIAEIATCFIDACRHANHHGIDLVALTDHSSIDGYRFMSPTFETIRQHDRRQGI
jgi:predicted metal-dependent phosphoesterase TrpH